MKMLEVAYLVHHDDNNIMDGLELAQQLLDRAVYLLSPYVADDPAELDALSRPTLPSQSPKLAWRRVGGHPSGRFTRNAGTRRRQRPLRYATFRPEVDVMLKGSKDKD